MATDDFNRANNTDLGANWDSYSSFNSLDVNSNAARAGAVGGDDTMESWNADSFANDQFFESTIGLWSGSEGLYVGGILRAAAPDTHTMYVFYGKAPGATIYKRVAGSSASIADDVSEDFDPGDVVRGEAEGTALRLKKNGALVLSGSDSGISSGRAGVAVYISDGLTVDDATINSWAAGNIGGSVTTLTADKGDLTLTGRTALMQTKLAAQKGDLTLTGQSAIGQIRLAAQKGDLALTPGTSVMRIVMAANKGDLTLTGGDATLFLGMNLVADKGDLALTPGTAVLQTKLVAQKGDLTLTSGAAVLQTKLTAEKGDLTLTPGAAILRIVMTATKGQLTLVGKNADFVGGGAPPVSAGDSWFQRWRRIWRR